MHRPASPPTHCGMFLHRPPLDHSTDCQERPVRRLRGTLRSDPALVLAFGLAIVLAIGLAIGLAFVQSRPPPRVLLEGTRQSTRSSSRRRRRRECGTWTNTRPAFESSRFRAPAGPHEPMVPHCSIRSVSRLGGATNTTSHDSMKSTRFQELSGFSAPRSADDVGLPTESRVPRVRRVQATGRTLLADHVNPKRAQACGVMLHARGRRAQFQ